MSAQVHGDAACKEQGAAANIPVKKREDAQASAEVARTLISGVLGRLHRFMETPQAKDKALMPTFPSRTEGMRSHQQKSPDPRVVETRRAELTKALNKKDGGLFSFGK